MLNIDSIVVLLFLIATFALGIISSRNVNSLKEFAIGDYKFSTSTLIAATTATWIGGGPLIAVHEKVYQFGLVWMIIFLGGVFSIFLFYKIAPGIIKFKGTLSAAEILGEWYGPKARTIGGICVVLYSIGIIGTQIAVIGILFNQFFQISPLIGILIGAGIVIMYSSFGGIKAITYSDVLQFAFFMITIPLIASILLEKVGGLEGIINQIPAEHFKIFPNYGTRIEYISLFLFFAIPFCDACLIQRVLMAKNLDQAITSFRSTMIVMLMFYLLCGEIALSVYVLDPNITPNLVFYHIIDHYLPIGIKGLAIAGALAVVMSTADSYLNVSSVAIISDIIKPLIKKTLNSNQEIKLIRFATFIIGCFAIIFATSSTSIIDLIFNAWMIWAPIVTIPLYAAILGIKSNFTTFLVSGIAGICTLFFWEIFHVEDITNIANTIPALLTNFITFAACTFYFYKYNPHKLFQFTRMMRQNATSKINSKKNIMIV